MKILLARVGFWVWRMEEMVGFDEERGEKGDGKEKKEGEMDPEEVDLVLQ